MGEGHHLCSSYSRIRLSRGDPGLVQPICALLGAFDDTGHRLLSGGVGASAPNLEAGDFQHEPRAAVHERGVHEASGKRGGQSERGRSRPGVRQHLYLAALAFGQGQGGLSS